MKDIEADLMHYYDTMIYIKSDAVPYESLSLGEKEGICKSLGFAVFRCGKALNGFIEAYREMMLSSFSKN